MNDKEGRQDDGMNIDLAKQEKGTQPNFMSENYFTKIKRVGQRVSRLIRLGSARNRYLRGNVFPLFTPWYTESVPKRRLGIEINILGWDIIIVFAVSVVNINEILDSDD